MKYQIAFLVLPIIALGLCCEQATPPDQTSTDIPPADTLGGAVIGSVFMRVDGVRWPLVGALIEVDTIHAQSDSTGSFALPYLNSGLYPMHVSHPSIIPIDTSMLIAGDTTPPFIFVMHRFIPRTYRFYLPHEVITEDWIPPFNRVRTEINSTITLDDRWVRTTSNYSCDFGYVKQGVYSVHVDATESTYPLDTVLVVDRSTLFLEYALTAQSIPVPAREFVYPLHLGAKWWYSYEYINSPRNSSSTTIRGTHAWTVHAIAGSVVSMLVVRTDTTTRYSTTSVSTDTLTFDVSLSGQTYRVPWYHTTASYDYNDTIPRFHFFSTDTLDFRLSTGTVRYISRVGLEDYTFDLVSNIGLTREHLKLLSFDP